MPRCCLRMGSLVMRTARPLQANNLLQKRLGKQVNGNYEYVVLNVLNAGESVWGYEDVKNSTSSDLQKKAPTGHSHALSGKQYL